ILVEINGNHTGEVRIIVTDSEGNVIGKVCSGTQSPSCGIAIGTAHVQTAFSKKDTEIFIKVREKLLKAVVVRMPFYKG
ncbi:MAG: glycine cleavage T C-terminal barrel domain-containing protein, partial [Bacteroidales bacterium]|nr:glycine cleavage T C-terminal barrel domain-containing protein [Bacteroidales bacterium]